MSIFAEMSYYNSMELVRLKLQQIRPPSILLRPVKLESVEFAEMLDSIRDHGLWQPLLVRPLSVGYEVVDGNYRYTCCKHLHLSEAPCIVRDLTDSEVLLAQLQANGIGRETTPVEFSERLNTLMKHNPGLTVPKLSVMIRKSPDWIRKVLRLSNLRADAQRKLKEGLIPVQSAYELSALPNVIQGNYLEQAETLSVSEFLPLIRAERKRLRERLSSEHILNHPVNQEHPVPFLRPFVEIKEEYRHPRVAGPILVKSAAWSPIDGWRACLAWILHMDRDSIVAQEKMIEARRDQRLRAEERRKQERRQLKEAREKAARNQMSQNPRIDT